MLKSYKILCGNKVLIFIFHPTILSFTPPDATFPIPSPVFPVPARLRRLLPCFGVGGELAALPAPACFWLGVQQQGT
jgi:hypothetical protein